MKALICGGGTGGHFFSGVALAERLLQLYPDARVIFVGTKNGIEARYTLTHPQMSKAFISSKGVKGKGLHGKILGLLAIVVGIFQSWILLFRERPDFVVGVGGYASAPTVFAAIWIRWILRFKILVLDQNSQPGLVNRILSKFPLSAYCAFPYPGFQLVDLPIRQKMWAKAQTKRAYSWPPRSLLILGGSQGAHGLNEKWKEVARALSSRLKDLQIIHQSGVRDEESLRNFYQELGLSAQVMAFSDEMERFYDQADLILCRSGAMTVFEILAFGRPTIFVPYPFAADDHQFKNAAHVQAADWIIRESDFTAARFAQCLDSTSPRVPAAPQDLVENWDRILRRP